MSVLLEKMFLRVSVGTPGLWSHLLDWWWWGHHPLVCTGRQQLGRRGPGQSCWRRQPHPCTLLRGGSHRCSCFLWHIVKSYLSVVVFSMTSTKRGIFKVNILLYVRVCTVRPDFCDVSLCKWPQNTAVWLEVNRGMCSFIYVRCFPVFLELNYKENMMGKWP